MNHPIRFFQRFMELFPRKSGNTCDTFKRMMRRLSCDQPNKKALVQKGMDKGFSDKAAPPSNDDGFQFKY